MVNEQRGSSGATFSIGHDSVVKRGNQRVGEQGRWIRDHSAPSLPEVFSVSDHAYSMERLIQLPINLVDTPRMIDHVKTVLTRDIWVQPGVVQFNMLAHLKRLDPLPIEPHVAQILSRARSTISWGELKPCLTHGDPILDNVLYRVNGDLVLTDPIPATLAIPDLQCVDIGRLIQSGAGYERYRYDLDGPTTIEPLDLVLGWGLSKNELLASCYFAAVHTLRSLVYVDGPTRKELAVMVLSAILDDVKDLI